MTARKETLRLVTDAEVEAGAHALAERFFIIDRREPLSFFSGSQQQDFRDKARAVLEAAERARGAG